MQSQQILTHKEQKQVCKMMHKEKCASRDAPPGKSGEETVVDTDHTEVCDLTLVL